MEGALGTVIGGLRNRWMMAVSSFFILSFAGSTYIFGMYSQTIKVNLDYDQEVIDMLAFFKDLGLNVGIIAGLINELSCPWVVLGIGSVMNSSGYMMIWLSVTGRIARPAKWQMYLYQLIGGSSMTFINTAVIVTCVKNFPRGRGLVIGLLKGFVGLSGAIITQIYLAANVDNPSFLILLAATLPTTVVLIFMVFIRPIEGSPKEKNEIKNFYVFLVMALVLAGFLMVFILLENRLHLPLAVIRIFAVITILTIFVPLLVVIRSQLQKIKSNEATTLSDVEKSKKHEFCKEMTSYAASSQGLDSSTDYNRKDPPMEENLKSQKKWPVRGQDHTVFQALMSIDFWILFLATTCGLGSTITAIDNMGQIGKSLQYPKESISTFVSLLSIWNFLGRVGSGSISEILMQKYSIPRPFLLSLVLAIACVGHLLIAFGLPGSIYVASILIGMCFGAQWPLMFSIISELFGLRHFAILYNIGQSSSPLGAYLFSVRVAGYLYDRRAKAENVGRNNALDELMCVGRKCFCTTFLIMAALSMVGCAIAGLLVYRTNQFYKQDIYGKFSVESKEDEKDASHLPCSTEISTITSKST
ncbi:hypothetical protein SUGI_0991660 [Cryptomeria japonica]|uniref:protein NUCLEAR FUSION DEFECTIVE 4 n=1 Tax=Cryptomeria japonica TaxID=3369 RepID=UPI002414CF20|nr:protein NUCLEAR FUSION DEFECTIVE 4 [Cryptomeria japonica]GLJ46980.1 hypothetical protein SUGI_0991660 [Cryptomeria japonica]